MATAGRTSDMDGLRHTGYREYAPPRLLADHLRCSWVSTVGDDSPAASHILPDGCLDIILMAGERLVVVGPDTRSRRLTLPPGTRYIGVRFHPGAAPSLLGVPASELLDRTVALDDLRGRDADRWVDRALAAKSADAVLAAIHGALLNRLPSAGVPDELVRAATGRLARLADVRVYTLSDELGVSERQLLRRFRMAVGYGPKTFQRVMRLQRTIRVVRGSRDDCCNLALLAAQTGYADQAHMTRDFSQLADASPARFFDTDAGAR